METPLTDLVDLRAFCHVVDLGSITAAAKALGEGKGSISRRLTRLEDALGVRLLRRSPRLVQATDEGAAFRQQVGRALDVLRDAAQSIQHRGSAPSGHLRVTAPVDLAIGLLAPLVAGFTERYPQVTVEMLLTPAFLDFDAHQIDVAVRATPTLKDSALVAHKLADIEIGPYASPAYIAKHGAPRGPADLPSHRFFMLSSQRGTGVLTLRRRGEGNASANAGKSKKRDAVELTVSVAVAASDFAFCRELALTGRGIGVLPSTTVRDDVAHGALVRLLPEISLGEASIYLLHSGSRLLPPKVRAFRDYVEREWSEREARCRSDVVSGSAT